MPQPPFRETRIESLLPSFEIADDATALGGFPTNGHPASNGHSQNGHLENGDFDFDEHEHTAAHPSNVHPSNGAANGQAESLNIGNRFHEQTADNLLAAELLAPEPQVIEFQSDETLDSESFNGADPLSEHLLGGVVFSGDLNGSDVLTASQNHKADDEAFSSAVLSSHVTAPLPPLSSSSEVLSSGPTAQRAVAEPIIPAPAPETPDPPVDAGSLHPACGSLFSPFLVTECRELRKRSKRRRSWWRRLFG